MPRSILEIILKVLSSQATKELKKFDKEIEKVDDSVKKSSKSFLGMDKSLLKTAAAFSGAGFAAIKARHFGQWASGGQ
jgi:hypothetical protein